MLLLLFYASAEGEQAGLLGDQYEEAILAAGCFWSVELRYQRVRIIDFMMT